MGLAIDTVSGHVTQPNTGLPWTMNTGDSLTVRNTRLDSRIFLLDMWARNNVAGFLSLRSPKLHDNVQGIRVRVNVTDSRPRLPLHMRQPLWPQDTLITNHAGSNVGGNIESGSLLLFYEDLPGSNARLIDEATLISRMVNCFTVESVLTAVATGDYGASRAINADFDLFKANTDYALMGYLVSADCTTIGWRGADVGNLRVSGPGSSSTEHLTSEWFVRLSRMYRLPTIPVFNSANKFGITLDMVTDQAAGAVTVTSIMAELSPGPIPDLSGIVPGAFPPPSR
jgi:hypothetical protein